MTSYNSADHTCSEVDTCSLPDCPLSGHFATDSAIFHDPSYSFDILRDMETTSLSRVDASRYLRFRCLIDVLVSATALIVLLPVMSVIGALVLVDVYRPIIFQQVRPGRHMRPFKLYKFRTMRHTYDERSGSQLCDYKRRTSPFGRLLRRTRLDELPQLYNVMIGNMALIGPRPLLPRDLPKEPALAERAALRPGITGWAQVHGGHQLKAEEKVVLDCWYARHASPAVDARIVILTITMMIGRRQRRPDTAEAQQRPRIRRFSSREMIDCEHRSHPQQQPEADDVGQRMHNAGKIAQIIETGGETIGGAEPALGLAQHQQLAVERQPATVKPGDHSLPGNRRQNAGPAGERSGTIWLASTTES